MSAAPALGATVRLRGSKRGAAFRVVALGPQASSLDGRPLAAGMALLRALSAGADAPAWLLDWKTDDLETVEEG